jgi:hypothetical protein
MRALEEHIEGMAGEAGWGPENTTCRQCFRWGRMNRPAEYDGRMLAPAVCRLAAARARAKLVPIPHDTPSCKFFEPVGDIPPVVAPDDDAVAREQD